MILKLVSKTPNFASTMTFQEIEQGLLVSGSVLNYQEVNLMMFPISNEFSQIVVPKTDYILSHCIFHQLSENSCNKNWDTFESFESKEMMWPKRVKPRVFTLLLQMVLGCRDWICDSFNIQRITIFLHVWIFWDTLSCEG